MSQFGEHIESVAKDTARADGAKSEPMIGGTLVPPEFVPFLLSGKTIVGPTFAFDKDGLRLVRVSEACVLSQTTTEAN